MDAVDGFEFELCSWKREEEATAGRRQRLEGGNGWKEKWPARVDKMAAKSKIVAQSQKEIKTKNK
jgi:hypothetical protein